MASRYNVYRTEPYFNGSETDMLNIQSFRAGNFFGYYDFVEEGYVILNQESDRLCPLRLGMSMDEGEPIEDFEARLKNLLDQYNYDVVDLRINEVAYDYSIMNDMKWWTNES